MIWRVLLFELIIVLVIVGVWLCAPLVGIESVFWRVMIILGLVLPPIAIVIWKIVSERKAAAGLENEMKAQGKAHQQVVRPDRREEIDALNDQFSQAVSALKRSKLGGGRGRALYTLPWYMIIGPPAVGKSTALVRSGLRFPFATGDRKSIKGIGGTRNCDWWFSDQAILLDTAGRYTSEDDDQEEWLSFLRMTRRFRRRRPLNGLLVAASVADLLTARPDQIEDMALQIRSRVDQVIGELDLALPIYLLFTKCDLISGFVEFFGDLKKSTRTQILGFTVPLTDPSTDIEGLFHKEMDLLTGQLRERAMARMASARPEQRAAVFQFPLQFAAAQDPLATFAAQLLSPNPYQEAPRLRGVYFCSGTQEGRPVDRVMAAMTRALGLKELGRGGFKERKAKKSYFLRDVFTEVIIPDQHLAGTTKSGLQRRRRLGIAGLAAALALSAGALGLWGSSYFNNRQMINSTVSLAKRSRITTPEDPRKVTDSLKALDELGQRVDTLERYGKEGVPWSLSLGYYQGEQLFLPARKVYIKRMWQAFVMPAGSELEATLTDIAGTSDYNATGAARDFDLLKAYLMVTEPQKRLEIDFAAEVLIGQWKKRLHPDVSQEIELLERNAKRYLDLLKRGEAGWLDRDENLIHNVRHALRARDAEYLRIIGEASSRLRPFTLRDALRGKVQDVLRAKHSVPGAYTRQGWSKFVRKRLLKQTATGSKLEPWVLGEEGVKDPAKRLKKRYYDHYIAAWSKFLDGLSVERGATPESSLLVLEKLTEQPALYKELLEAVVINTELPLVEVEGDPSRALSGVTRALGRTGQKLRRATRIARRTGLDKVAKKALAGHKGPVERYFEPLHELVRPPPGVDGRPQISGLEQYLEQLGQVRQALGRQLSQSAEPDPDLMDKVLAEARQVTKGVLASLPGALRRPLEPLFYTPLDTSAGGAKQAIHDRTGRSFSNDLCEAFKEQLAGRYPFAKSDRDAAMQDVIDFFSPKGLVWNYYDRRLRSSLPRRGNSFAPAPGRQVPGGVVDFINQSWQVTRALFPRGSEAPEVRFEVRPRPALLAAGRDFQISEIVLEIEGKSLTYRNGPIEQWSFVWTGQNKRARLLVRGAMGLREELTRQGEWSLMHLIDAGKAQKRGSWTQVIWSLKGGQVRIPMDFRPARAQNPLFSRLRLSCQ